MARTPRMRMLKRAARRVAIEMHGPRMLRGDGGVIKRRSLLAGAAATGAPLAALTLTCLAGAAAAADCAPDVADLRDADTTVRFSVVVADTEKDRARGLMFREHLPHFAGMLFVFESPQPVAFWMRNTLIPLDMLFFDETGRLTWVHSNAPPLDETPISGGTDIRYVLEIIGGLAEALGIEPGAELRHPSMDQARAAWSCAG
jgi:uncharacterized protein